jgi:hypothetical protein
MRTLLNRRKSLRYLLYPLIPVLFFCTQAGATTIGQADLFINAVYLDLLNRPADSAAYTAFAAPIANGTITDTQMAMDVLISAEYRTDLITSYYQSYLSRSPQPMDINTWLNFFGGGGTDEGLQANLFGSNEFFQKQGATNAFFVTAVYADLLNRPPGSGELTTWVNLLNSSTLTTTQMAANVLGSVEYDSDLVTGYYAQFLNRTPGNSELNTWVNDIQGGATNEQVIAAILGSQEFFDLAQQTPAQGQTSAPEPGTLGLVSLSLASVGFLFVCRRLRILK